MQTEAKDGFSEYPQIIFVKNCCINTNKNDTYFIDSHREVAYVKHLQLTGHHRNSG